MTDTRPVTTVTDPEGNRLVQIDCTDKEQVAALTREQLVHLVGLMARDILRMGYGTCSGYMRRALWDKEGTSP